MEYKILTATQGQTKTGKWRNVLTLQGIIGKLTIWQMNFDGTVHPGFNAKVGDIVVTAVTDLSTLTADQWGYLPSINDVSIRAGVPQSAPAPQAPIQQATAPTQAPQTAPVQTEKEKHMDEMARIRDAWTEKLITALERNTLMMERMLTFWDRKPSTGYPDYAPEPTKETKLPYDREPTLEDLKKMADEEGY